MSKVAVVYYSGYGHTKVVAENFANEIQADLIAIDQQGNISEQEWTTLDQADAIVFGAPTYMASTPWQFKKFADDSSKRWFIRAWQDKIFAGFTNSGSINGDKQMTLIQLQALALQHGGIWVSLGILPSNKKSAARNDPNCSSYTFFSFLICCHFKINPVAKMLHLILKSILIQL